MPFRRAHHGVDQQTLEARAYAVARKFKPLLVNTVVGFIGPEYLYDGKQIIRAGLEDHFCGKLLGLPMGVDVCYTNHAEADQDDMDTLLTLLGAAGVNYIMGVPGADDIMLNYQSTSFHDAGYLRQLLKLRPAPEFEQWLQKMGVMDGDCRLQPITQKIACSAKRWRRRNERLAYNTRSMDVPPQAHDGAIALGRAGGSLPTGELLKFSWDHAQARDAVHSELDWDRLRSDLAGAGLPIVRVASRVPDRLAYLQRPDLGCQLDDKSRDALLKIAPAQGAGCDLSLIVGDGLSALAAQLHAATVINSLVPLLNRGAFRLAPLVLAHHARVALQDEISQLFAARASLILLGERPGLGSPDSLGAYLVFDPRLGNTNAQRNCVSNIRPAGLPPAAAAETLHYLIAESLRRQLSGIALKDERTGYTLPARHRRNSSQISTRMGPRIGSA